MSLHFTRVTIDANQVEIGLLHDMAFAKSVATEPLTSDDWEIIVCWSMISFDFPLIRCPGNPCISRRIYSSLSSPRSKSRPGDQCVGAGQDARPTQDRHVYRALSFLP